MTIATESPITQALERVNPAVLEVILDAGVYEEHRAVVVEASEHPLLDEQVHRVLLECGAEAGDEGTYLFGSLEDIQCLMDEVTRLLERDESGHSLEPEAASQTEENEFIVFDDAPWVTPETLPEENAEALGLEQKGYALRRFPFSSIRVVPANNPRSKTERAGIVRLARNIARRGLQQPVTVRPDPEDESSVELVFGYRRMAAIGYAIAQGWLPEDYDVVCIVRKLNDSQTRLAALTENEEREEVDVLDQAEGWARLRLTQTESGIADAAGVSLTAVRRCLKVAFGVCEEAKALYRQERLEWGVLIALSYGSLEAQRAYLESAQGAPWKLSAEFVRQAMQAQDFKLANARFSLEEYEAVGGLLETDLWNSAEGARLRSREVIERLQTAWAERQLEDLKARGFTFVELRSGAWTWWSEFNRAARDAEGAGAVVHIRPDWAVDIIEGIVPNQPATGTNGVSSQTTNGATSSGGFTTDPTTGITTKLEEPKTEHSEAGITLARRLRTAALQQAILENTDVKLPLALAVLGFLGEREVRFSVKYLGESDALASKTILAELETFAARLPHIGFSPTRGLEFSVTGRHDASRCLETLNALLNLAKSDLERLHRLLVATMIGDFVAATDGAFQERKRSLKVSGVIAGLAAHLGVKGGEAWEIGEDYLKTISFRKARLEPYLAAALGETLARALMDHPKAKIIAEVLAHKAKIPGDFTPPELEFSRHANPVAVKLEVQQDDLDDFEDELKEPGEHAGLISEDDLRFVTKLEETELDEDAAD